MLLYILFGTFILTFLAIVYENITLGKLYKLIPSLRITDPLLVCMGVDPRSPTQYTNYYCWGTGSLGMSLNPDNDLGSSDQAFAAVLASNAI